MPLRCELPLDANCRLDDGTTRGPDNLEPGGSGRKSRSSGVATHLAPKRQKDRRSTPVLRLAQGAGRGGTCPELSPLLAGRAAATCSTIHEERDRLHSHLSRAVSLSTDGDRPRRAPPRAARQSALCTPSRTSRARASTSAAVPPSSAVRPARACPRWPRAPGGSPGRTRRVRRTRRRLPSYPPQRGTAVRRGRGATAPAFRASPSTGLVKNEPTLRVSGSVVPGPCPWRWRSSMHGPGCLVQRAVYPRLNPEPAGQFLVPQRA